MIHLKITNNELQLKLRVSGTYGLIAGTHNYE